VDYNDVNWFRWASWISNDGQYFSLDSVYRLCLIAEWFLTYCEDCGGGTM